MRSPASSSTSSRSSGTTSTTLTFARECLKNLAAAVPALAPELDAIAGKLVDLFALVRNHIYHPDVRAGMPEEPGGRRPRARPRARCDRRQARRPLRARPEPHLPP